MCYNNNNKKAGSEVNRVSGQEIKALIQANGLKCWQVADALGMQDSNFSRRLRKPFDEKAVEMVKAAIAKLKAAKEK